MITIIGSIKAGIGWGPEGPKSGFFPFYIGVIIICASLVNCTQLLMEKDDGQLFSEWGQLGQVLCVLVPTTVYAILIPYLGIYVASVILIALFVAGLLLITGSSLRTLVSQTGRGVGAMATPLGKAARKARDAFDGVTTLRSERESGDIDRPEHPLLYDAAADDDVWALSDSERRALGIEPLPQNLGEAIDLMERSELVAETLGEHVFEFFLRNKKQEWEEYRSQVTAFELMKNLPNL